MEAVQKASLDPWRPFASLGSKLLSCRIRHHCARLFRQGLISDVYSAHDLRHYFAVEEHLSHKDIFRLQHLLGHSGISVTEVYLKSLGLPLTGL